MTKQKKSKVTEAEAFRKAIDARPHIIRGMSFSEQEYEEIRKIQREHDIKLADAALMFNWGQVSHATAKIHLEKLKKVLGEDHANE